MSAFRFVVEQLSGDVVEKDVLFVKSTDVDVQNLKRHLGVPADCVLTVLVGASKSYERVETERDLALIKNGSRFRIAKRQKKTDGTPKLPEAKGSAPEAKKHLRKMSDEDTITLTLRDPDHKDKDHHKKSRSRRGSKHRSDVAVRSRHNSDAASAPVRVDEPCVPPKFEIELLDDSDSSEGEGMYEVAFPHATEPSVRPVPESTASSSSASNPPSNSLSSEGPPDPPASDPAVKPDADSLDEQLSQWEASLEKEQQDERISRRRGSSGASRLMRPGEPKPGTGGDPFGSFDVPARSRSNAFYGPGALPPNPFNEGLPAIMQSADRLPAASASGIVLPVKKPEKKKPKDEHVRMASSRFSIGYADTIGRRPTNEDSMVISGYFRGKPDEDLVAIFDGHGGPQISAFSAKKIEDILTHELKHHKTEPMRDVLRDTFNTLNEKVRDARLVQLGGCTALVAVFLGDKGYVANVGDSRAVLYRDGEVSRVSVDHKPNVPEEERRILSLGGRVTTTLNKFGASTSRLQGVLAVSRAIGDFALEPYISAEPYVHEISLGGPSKNHFLIMACDGLWDMINDKEAANMIAGIADPEKAAIRLRDHAFQQGSDDNISVIVIRFPPLVLPNS
eukprot:TRINITY_DN627_c0_g1_i1.p1 TRINITY_DN627_c0_g1~~TRINITY_DN627_c0_g1_i1.p1  ORF type:complete len:621 (+),score=214.55 TRINITY_DN627_c0_g1_i1:221-2083(+)